MGTTLSAIDAMLNLTWVVVALAVLLGCRAAWAREHRRALVAVLCMLVLLFPVISTADDLGLQAVTYDPSASPLAPDDGAKNKHFVAPALLTPQLAYVLARLLPAGSGEEPCVESIPGCTARLSSASGIHSPPQF